MNGVEILSSEIIYNTILPEYWLGIGFGCALVFFLLWHYVLQINV